jgi:hypothetical protein
MAKDIDILLGNEGNRVPDFHGDVLKDEKALIKKLIEQATIAQTYLDESEMIINKKGSPYPNELRQILEKLKDYFTKES